MAKFKVGDRGRDIEGAEALIVAVPDDKCIIVEWCGYEGLRGKWPHDSFELVTPSPVQAVTRVEIVPGEYGRLKTISVNTGTTGMRAAVGVDTRFYTKADLLEAARIFTEIADALEDEESTR